MSKTSRMQNTTKIITVPKHLLIYKKDVSPYNRVKDRKNSTIPKILTELKAKVGPSLKRGKTLIDKNYDEEIACLISVERNYVRELINSPLKYKSRSPFPTKKSSNVSPIKALQHNEKFESLTVCDFLGLATTRKLHGVRKNKSSITPDPFLKRK